MKHFLSGLISILLIFLSITTMAHMGSSPFMQQITEDYQAFYRIPHLGSWGVGLGISGLMANTHFDPWVRNEWQNSLRSHFSNQLSDNIDNYSELTQYQTSVPFYVAIVWLSSIAQLNPALSLWGNHCLRTFLLGAPQQALLTQLLGSARPDDKHRWDWFYDKRAVSGHAFYGAIPLLNCAHLTKYSPLKWSLLMLSTLPAFARINNDKHYTSQAFLGWWLAFSASQVIMQTDKVSKKPKNWSLYLVPYENTIFLGMKVKL